MDNFTIANTDTVHLQYSTQWFHGNWTDFSTQPPTNVSLLSSDDLQAQLVLRFPSPATGFYYYGMKRSGGGSYRICIDCDPNQPAGPFYTVDAWNKTDDGHNPPVVLYSNLTLSNDFHTIVLQNTNDTRGHPQGVSQITLQQFVITSPKVLSPTVTVIGTGAAITATTSPGPTSTGASVTSSTTNPGIIAGSVVGALVVLALLLGVGLWVFRRRRTSIPPSIEVAPAIQEGTEPDPFVVRPSQPPQSKFSRTFDRLGPSFVADSGIMTGNQRFFNPASSNSGTVTSSRSQTALFPSRPYIPHPHTALDAGPVPPSEDGDTLPPDYAQVFVSRAAGSQSHPADDATPHRTSEPASSTSLDLKQT
ncbi:hypothetical protein JB92DRAFT_3122919 [Gautieria morchelliformis]|nr:hypothetical protein JB92DRAFT_3122919 [Gautieria morchelliformis]